MSTLPDYIFDGLLKWTENSDSTELSRCNKKMRDLFERNKRRSIYWIRVGQIHLNNDQFAVQIRNNRISTNKEHFLFNLEQLNQKLKTMQVHSIELETTSTIAIEIIDFLGDDWFTNCALIRINCFEERKTDDAEDMEKLKRKTAQLLSRFEIIDNILITDDLIYTQSFGILKGLSRLRNWEKWQNRELSLKKANLKITTEDIEMFLTSSNASKRLLFWLPSRNERSFGAIREFWNRHQDNRGNVTFQGSLILFSPGQDLRNLHYLCLASIFILTLLEFCSKGLLAGGLVLSTLVILELLVVSLIIMFVA